MAELERVFIFSSTISLTFLGIICGNAFEIICKYINCQYKSKTARYQPSGLTRSPVMYYATLATSCLLAMFFARRYELAKVADHTPSLGQCLGNPGDLDHDGVLDPCRAFRQF